MSQLLAQLSELNWPKTVGMGVLAAAMYYFLAYNDGSGLMLQQQNAVQTLAESQRQLEETKAVAADAVRFENDIKQVTEQFKKLTEFMPAKQSLADVLTLISKAATKVNVNLTKVEPQSASERGEFYETSRVKIQLLGGYSEIVSFLSELTHLPRLFTLEKVKLQADSSQVDKSRVMFEADLVMYRYLAPTPTPAPADGTSPADQEAANASQ